MLQSWWRGHVGTLLPALVYCWVGLRNVRCHCRDMGNGRALGCGFFTMSGMVRPRGIVGNMALLQCWRCWQVGPLLHALLHC